MTKQAKPVSIEARIAQIRAQQAADTARLDRILTESLARDARVCSLLGL